MNFHHHQLPNGLTIVAEANPDAHTSAVGFFVKAGTRDEEKPLMGVSHFLEHMMFKATTGGRTADDVNREFDEIGANYNAYTSQETTVYYAQVLPEFLPRHWWQHILHNQTALLIKGALLFRPNLVVTSVPFHLER